MTEASSPGATALTAGALTATLDGPDLTHIRLGATELIRRILVTVRDTNWDTLQPQVLSSTMSVDSERFEISLEGQHVAACIEFSWHVSIRAEASGRLVYELDGRGPGPSSITPGSACACCIRWRPAPAPRTAPRRRARRMRASWL